MKFINYSLLFFSVLVFSITICGQTSSSSELIIQTKQGKLQGTTEKNAVLVWKGVRYAKPPVGDLRFKAPQPLENWDGIKLATTFGPIAPQVQKNVTNADQKTSEDCLYLNIWSTNIKNRKPVMFWIHGGGFYTGSGSSNVCNGAKLAQKGDVVVVTINYRIGALGFLYFDKLRGNDKNLESNLGIKDQIAALRWVKENIEQFGGDPDNITIFGQSAGGTSVLALMAAPSAKGLFHKAIAESPSAIQNWTPQEATQVTKKYLSKLNISENNLEKLYELPADSLVMVAYKMVQDQTSMIPGIGSIAPTVDSIFIKPLLSEEASYLPLLIGTTKNETNLFVKVKATPFEPTPKIIDRIIPSITETDKSRISTTYRRYPKEQSILNIMTDGIFRVPSIQKAETNAKAAPTYMYRFDWCSVPLNAMGYKSCHALDIFFVFNSFDSKAGKKITTLANKRSIYKVSNNIQEAWINFAKTGNPNNTGIETWKQYDTTSRATMLFDKKNKLAFDPDSKERLSWEGVKLD